MRMEAPPLDPAAPEQRSRVAEATGKGFGVGWGGACRSSSSGLTRGQIAFQQRKQKMILPYPIDP